MENNLVLTEPTSELNVEKEKKKQKAKQIAKGTFTYTLLTVFAFLSFFPFYWMIISSIKTETEYRLPSPTFFPQEFQWENYSFVIVEGNNGLLYKQGRRNFQ